MIASDLSPARVDELRARFGGNDKVEVVQGDAAAVIAGRTVDAVVMVNVLEHLDDDVKVLTQLRESLRPGGVVALVRARAARASTAISTGGSDTFGGTRRARWGRRSAGPASRCPRSATSTRRAPSRGGRSLACSGGPRHPGRSCGPMTVGSCPRCDGSRAVGRRASVRASSPSVAARPERACRPSGAARPGPSPYYQRRCPGGLTLPTSA